MPLSMRPTTLTGCRRELLDVVLAIVRDRPVEPVARITTHRETKVLYDREGAELAEFSNDHVTAWSAADSDGPDSVPPSSSGASGKSSSANGLARPTGRAVTSC